MGVCSVGTVQLDPSLKCTGLRSPGQSLREVAYAFGGKAIDTLPEGLILPDIYLTARFVGGDPIDKLYGYYTLQQIEDLLALPDEPQDFEHPYVLKRAMSGITVFMDKNSLSEENLTEVWPDQVAINPGTDSVYKDTDQVYLYYGQIRLIRLT
jgi:hypothetical protein